MGLYYFFLPSAFCLYLFVAALITARSLFSFAAHQISWRHWFHRFFSRSFVILLVQSMNAEHVNSWRHRSVTFESKTERGKSSPFIHNPTRCSGDLCRFRVRLSRNSSWYIYVLLSCELTYKPRYEFRVLAESREILYNVTYYQWRQLFLVVGWKLVTNKSQQVL